MGEMLINELGQFLLIGSILYIISIIIKFSIKLYSRLKFEKETRYTMSVWEKILSLMSLSYILANIF